MKRLAALVMIAILAGCASPEIKYTGYNIEYPEDRYLTAEGVGETEQQAKANARAELVAIFEARIRSEMRDSMISMSGPDGAEEFSQSVGAHLSVAADIELKGLEIGGVRNDKDGLYHAIAVLKRDTAQDTWRADMRIVEDDMEGELKSARAAKGILPRYKAMSRASALWLEREGINSRLNVIGRGVSSAMGPEMAGVYRSLASMRQSMPIFLDIKSENAGFVEALSEELSARGYVMSKGAEGAKVVVSGNVEAQDVDIEHPEWKYARAVVALSVRDVESGLVVGEVSEKVRAAHLKIAEARAQAMIKAAPMAAASIIAVMEK